MYCSIMGVMRPASPPAASPLPGGAAFWSVSSATAGRALVMAPTFSRRPKSFHRPRTSYAQLLCGVIPPPQSLYDPGAARRARGWNAMKGRLLVSLLIGLTLASPATAAELRMLTSWDRNNPAVPLLAEGFAKNVEKASNGRLTFVLNGPETVPPFEQLQPVAAGAFHMLAPVAIYHYGQTALAIAFDAVRGSMEERRASGLFEAADKHYQKLGLKVIAVPISAKTGYTFMLKAPVGAEGDLKGRKIRGTPSYHPVIRMLGGAPVVIPIPEVYTALEKGVIDGAASPVVGLLGVKWYEAAKFVSQPAFGYTHQIFLMNLDAWKRLSEGDKKILREEGRKIEDVWFAEYDRMAREEIAELEKRGATVTKLGPSQEKLNEVFAQGLWELAEKKSPAETKEIYGIAKAKGLTY